MLFVQFPEPVNGRDMTAAPYALPKFRADLHAEKIPESLHEAFLMPFPQGAEDAPFEFRVFEIFDEAGQSVGGFFHGGDDVPRQKFRQVVEEAGEEVVAAAHLAGADAHTEKVGEGGHREHVPEHVRGRNAGGFRPAHLKAELSAETGEAMQGAFLIEERVHALHAVPECVQLLREVGCDGRHFLIKAVHGLDEPELPL